MTFDHAFRYVIFQGDGAIGAAKIIAAISADEKGVKSPLVEKKQNLLFFDERIRYAGNQGIGKNGELA
jgi:hypothetical protein